MSESRERYNLIQGDKKSLVSSLNFIFGRLTDRLDAIEGVRTGSGSKDSSAKADRVTDAVDGDLASLDEVGNLEDSGISVDELDSALDSFSTTGVLAESGTAGQLFHFQEPNDKWYLASHTAELTITGELGILQSDATKGATGSFLTRGAYTTTGLNTAATYYVGISGSITDTEPDTEDYIIRVIGHAKSDTELIFHPSEDYFTLGLDSDDDVEIMMQTLTDILKTVKAVNLHMALITDTWLRDNEVDE